MTDKERADLVDYRLERAEKTLAEIAVLLENDFLNTAVNRLYYASSSQFVHLLKIINLRTISNRFVVF